MKKLLLLLFLPLCMHAMQTTLSFDESTRSLTITRPLPIRINSPSDEIVDKLPAKTSPKPLAASTPNIKAFDGMSVDEIKTWIVGTIAQYEQQHALTLQQLQDALDKHAATVTTAQNTAQNAQSSSKYAVIAAAVTGTCSILVCIASSLMSHYL